jgi:exodeoxyribonuclease V alpha subunit
VSNNLWPSPADLALATSHQRETYELATRGPVGVLSGGPGTGKTFLAAQIIRAIIGEYGPGAVAIAAPTGKAAQRLNELLLTHNIHGVLATTIHRMLGVQRAGHDGKGWGFMFNKETPLPKRFVFIDEASMLGTPLMASLMAALRSGTHILFIGDFAQLPPVEHGAPLRDMIAAGLPYGELIEVHRNGGDIVQACRDVKEGRSLKPSPAVNLELEEPQNLFHIEATTPTLLLGALGKLLRTCPPAINPAWDVQVLCAINKNTPVSRAELNPMLQNILNPDGQRIDDNGAASKFRLGDKVICLSNQMRPVVECPHCNYGGAEAINWTGKIYHCRECDRTWPVKEMMQDFVANGEIGKVTYLEKNMFYLSIETPERTIRVAGPDRENFDLAYAITTHRAQGSEWPVIIGMVDDSPSAYRICSWEWHRTLWSRARKLCFTVGKLGVIHRQCKKSALRDRKTFLTEILKEVA